MDKYEIIYSQDDVDSAIVYAVEDCTRKGTSVNKIFETVKENTLVHHILGSKTVKEIADRYQELVECQRCLPLEDKDAEQTVAASTVEDKALEDKDAEQEIVAHTVENKAGNASHSKHPIRSEQAVVAPTVKPSKLWSLNEDNALISLVKEYQSKEMTVTKVFEEFKSFMPLTHILYSRSAEALGTHYRKLVNNKKCPPLRGSINAVRNGCVGQVEKKRVEDLTARKNSGADAVPRNKRSVGSPAKSGADAVSVPKKSDANAGSPVRKNSGANAVCVPKKKRSGLNVGSPARKNSGFIPRKKRNRVTAGSPARKNGAALSVPKKKRSGVNVSSPAKKNSGANAGRGVDVRSPTRKNSGGNVGSDANVESHARENSGVGGADPWIGEELTAALDCILEYFATKVANKIADMFPKTKDAE